MNTSIKISLTIIGLSFLAPAFAAKDPNLKAIEARQGEMQLRSFNAGPLFAMAKGKMDYDAELAKKLSQNLVSLTELDMGRAWPKGSDKGNYPDKSDAKAEAWTTYPKVAEAGKKYKMAVNELAMVAGNGLDSLRGAIGPLGKSCKGCHDDFRDKD